MKIQMESLISQIPLSLTIGNYNYTSIYVWEGVWGGVEQTGLELTATLW